MIEPVPVPVSATHLCQMCGKRPLLPTAGSELNFYCSHCDRGCLVPGCREEYCKKTIRRPDEEES